MLAKLKRFSNKAKINKYRARHAKFEKLIYFLIYPAQLKKVSNF